MTRIRDVMIRNVTVAYAHEPVERALARMAAGGLSTVPVVSRLGHYAGALCSPEVPPRARATIVRDWARRDVHTAHPEERLEDTRRRLDWLKPDCVPVVLEERLVGVTRFADIEVCSRAERLERSLD